MHHLSLEGISRVTRTSRLAVVATCSALALTGCGSAVRTGAAAVVGDDRITHSQLQQAVEHSPQGASTAPPNSAVTTRTTLKRLISHDILAAAADQEGVSVNPGDVDAVYDTLVKQAGGVEQLQAAAAQKGIGAGDLRTTVSDIALQNALADKLTAGVSVSDAQLRAAYQSGIAQYDQVHVAHISVETKALADQVLAAAKAAPATFGALAAKYSLDPATKDKGGDVGFQGRGTLPPPIDAALFGNPTGSIVLVPVAGSFEILQLIERRTTTFEQAKPALRRAALGQQSVAAVQALLAKTANRLGVQVNPRYGHWDVKAQDIVDPRNGVSRPEGGDRAPAATVVPGS